MAISPDTAFGEKVAQTAPAKTTAANPSAATAKSAMEVPTVSNINAFIDTLKTKVADMNVASGLNPDGTQPTVTSARSGITAATNTRLGAILAQQNADALKLAAVKNNMPTDAPPGFHYTWIGTAWKLYKDAPAGVTGGGSGGSGSSGSGGSGDTGGNSNTGTPTTSVEVLKAMLKGLGFASTVIDSSATFLNSLLKDGLDYDNAVQVFLNTKDYTTKNGTKLSSPFYEQYGYLNEGLEKPRTASELYNAVEGYKELKVKYGFSDKYLSTDSLKNYVKNNVTVAELDERANAARLAAINADPIKSEALIKLGYISQAADLQDFYMDAKVGKEQLELNRNTGAFVAEAIRRAGSGLLVENIQLANYKQLAASLTGKGYTEAQIAQLASTGFQNVADNLNPTVALSGIYEKTVGNQDTTSMIQTELQNEEFMNMASARRKKLAEQNKKAFEGSAGITQTSLRTVNTGGIL